MHTTKNKSLLLTIIFYLSVLIGAQSLFTPILGEHETAITIAFATLAYQALVMYCKRFYNTGNWVSGWSNAFLIFNICTFGIELIALIQVWAPTANMELSQKYLLVTSKVTAIFNLIIFIVNGNWSNHLPTPFDHNTVVSEKERS